ncbi:prepilin-type N-terminal cleavage/methylation domain-containing protein [Candidatus Gottesmanbacteria bacterium]|nr:prepilin-type N-terminal cleavage/methylation domain-containing protein [Candidatus Gottesmanbacteria bacterium]
MRTKKGLPAGRQGITIIETMIALFILALMGGAIITLTLQILAANNSAKIKNQKVALVQKLLEEVRGFYQNNSWLTLSQKNSASCYFDTNWITNACADCSTNTIGQSIQVTTNASQVTVTATVTWSDRGQCRQTSETTYYYNY